MSIADFVGLIGVTAYLAAYGLLQYGALKVEDGCYALLNGIGSVAILYSLIFDFNLPSFITQTAWLIFTIVGYARSRSRQLPSQAMTWPDQVRVPAERVHLKLHGPSPLEPNSAGAGEPPPRSGISISIASGQWSLALGRSQPTRG